MLIQNFPLAVYIRIYIYVCVCVCVHGSNRVRHSGRRTPNRVIMAKCMHPKCRYTVHSNASWVTRFCCKVCRLQYHAGMYNLANEENSPPDLATAKLPPTEHGRNCEHQQYFGVQALPIVQNYWRRQQAIEEARAGFNPY